MLTPAPTERAEPCRLLEANDETVPLSVRRIRSSRRAGSILDKIKQTSPKAAPGTTAPLLDLGTVARNPRPSLDPNFNKNRFSPFVLSKFARPQNGSSKPALVLEPQLRALAEPADDVCKTPESKPRRYGPGTPYNMLRALSEKSSESGSRRPSSSDKPNELRSGDTQEYGVDPFMSTPVKQRTRAANESAPRSEHRQRIETLRKFFDKHLNDLIPNEAPDNTKTTPPPRRNNAELLISFDTADQRRGETSVPYTSHISQASSIRQSDGPEELLQSPSPLRPHRSLKETVNGTVDNDSATSLLLSFTSKQDIDGTRPIPFLLNQIEQQQQQDEQWTGDRSNLIDLSSRLNSSIHALNHGLREQLARTTAATNDQANLTPTAEAEETSSARAVNSSAPGRDRLIDTSIRTETSQQSELEGQVETLRKTMEETKSIVFSIQSQLGQQQQTHVAEDTKLGDIVRLLGALDMRLHMLEDRQRLDQSVNGSAAGSPMARRTNAGSTKMHPNNTQSQDLLSRLGQFIVHCLSQYPLMIIGALFIILISELLLISGFRLDLQSLNGYGRYAMDEVKRHINMPHPPS
ncbi:hypothetical protein H4S02_004424 [Coemansia sp. RSA 2611]|nr:hypothetical protein H4S02_004424 [Coemansia sp. RSA 2611]